MMIDDKIGANLWAREQGLIEGVVPEAQGILALWGFERAGFGRGSPCVSENIWRIWRIGDT